LARTKSLFPGTSATCDSTVAVPDPQQPDTAVRVGGNVQAARLLKKVAPEYPFDARARGIQGTVRFNATIGIDGTVRQLSLLSGPLALYESARAAVQKWAFKPMTQNNRPAEMVTVIEVDYTLSR
jgi:protein TonB